MKPSRYELPPAAVADLRRQLGLPLVRVLVDVTPRGLEFHLGLPGGTFAPGSGSVQPPPVGPPAANE